MRIYIPATAADLAALRVSPRLVHTVTDALRRALPEEPEEVLEAVAFNAATDDSLELVAEALRAGADVASGSSAGSSHLVALRRVVVAADVPNGALAAADDELETSVLLTQPVEWDAVASIHVDHEDAEPLLRDAIAHPDDESAADRAANEDLLWFDTSERIDLAVELGAAERV